MWLITVAVLFDEIVCSLRIFVMQNFLDGNNISENVNNLVADFENILLLPTIMKILAHISHSLTVDVMKSIKFVKIN